MKERELIAQIGEWQQEVPETRTAVVILSDNEPDKKEEKYKSKNMMIVGGKGQFIATSIKNAIEEDKDLYVFVLRAIMEVIIRDKDAVSENKGIVVNYLFNEMLNKR